MTTKTKKSKTSQETFDYKTIKSFEDACKKLNEDPTLLPVVSLLSEEFRKAIIAYYKLVIIFKAINNGWVPDWSKYSQCKYYPWFRILSSGFGFAYSYYYLADMYSVAGSRLCFSSKEMSDYAGKQFLELYKEFLTITK
jgi:hypothetical protein